MIGAICAKISAWFERWEKLENLRSEMRFLKSLRKSQAFHAASPQLKEAIRFEMYGLREKIKELER